jgi:hypothetical protein
MCASVSTQTSTQAHAQTRTRTRTRTRTHRDVIECELKEVDVQEIDLKSVATVCDYQDEELTLLEVIFRTTEVLFTPPTSPLLCLSLSLSLSLSRAHLLSLSLSCSLSCFLSHALSLSLIRCSHSLSLSSYTMFLSVSREQDGLNCGQNPTPYTLFLSLSLLQNLVP